MEFETIYDVINELNKVRYFPKDYETFGEVVEEIISMGNTDKVYAFYDKQIELLFEPLANSSITNSLIYSHSNFWD